MDEVEFYLKDLASRFKAIDKQNTIYLILVVKIVISYIGL